MKLRAGLTGHTYLGSRLLPHHGYTRVCHLSESFLKLDAKTFRNCEAWGHCVLVLSAFSHRSELVLLVPAAAGLS